jgi:hypothetical protein
MKSTQSGQRDSEVVSWPSLLALSTTLPINLTAAERALSWKADASAPWDLRKTATLNSFSLGCNDITFASSMK